MALGNTSCSDSPAANDLLVIDNTLIDHMRSIAFRIIMP